MPSSPLLINLSFLLSEPTGISTYAANVFPYLKNLEPTLLTAHEYPQFNCYPIPPNLTPAQGTKGHFNRLLWTQFELPKIYQKLNADLLFSPIPEAPLSKKIRTIIMVHDLIPLRFPRWKSPLTQYFKWWFPQVIRQAEQIICNSQATADDLVNFFQIPSSKITPILLAYNSQHFRKIDSLSLPETPAQPYFLYLGRHDPHKNLARLLTAFSKLPQCQDYQLWLAGPTDQRYTPKLAAQAQELGIDQQVRFLNYVSFEQLPILLNQAFAVVFPSLWEGFGFPVIEAMACGTPVITSNLSSLPEVAGDAALLIDPYQVDELTNAMLMLIKEDSLRSQLMSRSLEQAQKFSWSKTGQETAAVLQRFCELS
ncbi:MAG: glycosyltransferase family 1 protein [Snowella sp.]|nr:glycosyltransferase family 1 protein [Snowella sp.]